MGALEHLWQLADESQLADMLLDDHLEQAVVQLRIRCGVHASAIGLRVGDADRVSREAVTLAGRVELDLKARRLPGRQRAQRAVYVDQPAEPAGSLVGNAIGIAVEPHRGDPDIRSR